MVDDVMHEDMIFELKQEIERLRDLLWESDIDPDPIKEMFGPPTASEANISTLINATLRARAPQMVAAITRQNPLLTRLSQKSWSGVYNV